MNLTKLLLILFFFTLPLVHGNLLPTLGIPFSLSVSGNFEFSKVIYFNILSGLIFLSFFGERIFSRGKFSQSQLPRCSQDSSQSQLPLLASQVIPLHEGNLGSSINLPHGGRWLSVSEDGGSCDGVNTETSRESCDWRGASLATGGVFLILLLSTLFSISPFISLIGDTEKGHTALMYLNLLGLFFVLKQLEKTFLQKLIFTSLLAGFGVCLLALREFFFPSFDYGELANRALGSFGHPNYLAGYLLLLLPFTVSQYVARSFSLWEKVGMRALGIIFLLTLLLTKSIVALFLALGYIIYTLQLALSKPHHNSSPQGEDEATVFVSLVTRPLSLRRGLGGGFVGGTLILLSLTFLVQFFPEKLHSFLSRFYLWETTLYIIFSDPKIFFFGAGAETLPYFFDSFKAPEVYIYENFGYTADRAHNFFLDIFFQFGIFGALLFLYCIFMFLKNFKNTIFSLKISLLLFLLFGIFHYFSIASYVIIILLLTLSPQDTSLNSLLPGEKKLPFFSRLQLALSPDRGKLDRGVWGVGVNISLFLLLTLLSLSGAYFSLQLYRSELAFASGNTQKAQEIFAHPAYLIELGRYDEAQSLEGLLSQNNLKEQIITEPERQENCNKLTSLFPSAENYFYCGDIFWQLGKVDIAKNYYRQGLLKLPDLWNSDSVYWQQYFVYKSITGNRFFSETFSDISEILQKLEISIESK